MTKIDIISGFLGAGKTTLIKKLIAQAFVNEKLVLIENEFGEIGIDGGFLKESGIEITEMNSGCICCSLVGDFGTALREVIEKYNPDRIIIEPSGVGKLSDVIKAVEKVATDCDVKINSLVAVADAKKTKIYMKNFGEFFNNQIEAARTIILSRTDAMKQDKLEALTCLIKEHNEHATIITTPWDDIDGKLILQTMESEEKFQDTVMKEEVCPECGHVHHHHHEHQDGECCHVHHHDHDHEHHHHEHQDGECCHGHHHDHDHEHHHHEHQDDECCCGHHHDHDHGHHHADDVFTSWGTETVKVFNKDELEKVLEVLSESDEYGVILRSKGIVKEENGGWLQFDLVPGEYELRDSQADVTGKLCVIGTKLNEEEIKRLFGLN
ncbi:MAG: GTP-binding protein [Lachnospiraceae bacterium]|nr:GTP-binding protein [Lachnospiraceae bacterium]